MGGFSRRSFLEWLCSGVVLPVLHFAGDKFPPSHDLVTRGRAGGSIGKGFQGEERRYRMSALWIMQAAIGRLSFEKVGGGESYRALLEGKTTGIIGWLTRYRRDTYTSYMEVIDGGKRLRPLRCEEDVEIGGRIRKKITVFDYGRRKLVKKRMNKEGMFVQTEEKIPAGVGYDDFLTAFYNFRGGAYGEIERGKRYRVRTLPKAGMSTIEVEIGTREEEIRMRHGEPKGGDREYYITVFLDKEITRSRTGRVAGWVSKDLVPVEGTIEDVKIVGDVRGVLMEERRPYGYR
jgi:hypothetical protein